MALADLMALSLDKSAKKVGLSEERISAQIDKIRQYVSF
jgi:biotin operon repressor